MDMFTEEIVTNLEAQALVRRWIETLRGDKYEQGQGYLRTQDDTYCCLGVVCDLVDPRGWVEIENADEGEWGYLSRGPDAETFVTGVLPLQIMNALCFGRSGGEFVTGFFSPRPAREDEDDEDSLISMNDGGRTFGEIADTIERKLEAALAGGRA